MERSGTLPSPAVDLDDLRHIAAGAGPFLSVVLPIDRAVEQAARQNEARWKSLRAAVADHADAAALDAVQRLVPLVHQLDADCVAIVCDGPELVLVEGIEAVAATGGVARVEPVPHLVPVIMSRQRAVAYVVVLADRRGADLIAVSAGGHATTEEVELEDDRPERQIQAGGWSQRRYQQRARNRWEDGAEAIADEVAKLGHSVGARLLIIGADDRTASELQHALPAQTFDLVRCSNESRAAGAESDLDGEVRRYVHDVAARDSVAVIEKLREELGQHDRAVEGIAPTLDALRRAQVAELLVHDDETDERRAWFGDAASAVALERADVEDLGVVEPREGRLLDVSVRSALLSSADVRVLPRAAAPREGIGALLRWS